MKKIYKPILFAVLFFTLIVLLKTYDVQAIGPMGTTVGFARLNYAVHNLFGVHVMLYNITELFGLIAILVAAAFAVLGLVQWIKRKIIAKVDMEILALGCLYIIVIATYFFFEKKLLNYRPVIMPGRTAPEASFPSSHAMVVCVIMGSAIMLSGKYIKNIKLRKTAVIVSYLIIAITIIGRLVSGVHWFTDIVGGILSSLTLLSAYSLVIGSKGNCSC